MNKHVVGMIYSMITIIFVFGIVFIMLFSSDMYFHWQKLKECKGSYQCLVNKERPDHDKLD